MVEFDTSTKYTAYLSLATGTYVRLFTYFWKILTHTPREGLGTAMLFMGMTWNDITRDVANMQA